MFVKGKDLHDESWNGSRTGTEGVKEYFGADEAYDIEQLPSILRHLLQSSSSPLYFDFPHSPSQSRYTSSSKRSSSLLDNLSGTLSSGILGWGRQKETEVVMNILSGNGDRRVKGLIGEIERMRIIKSENEIVVMRQAADVSAEAHKSVMGFCKPSLSEHELVAHFEYISALRQSQRPAYVPVCATSSNDLPLKPIHYTANHFPLEHGQLVLLDAGCEWGMYASDITRTFPVDGTFSPPQRDLYLCLLEVQKELAALCTEDKGYHLLGLHSKSVTLLTEGLRNLGFHGISAAEVERKIYPHFISHPVGIDLHDTPVMERNEKLRKGMVITVEPSILVPDDIKYPKEFRNLAMRIEDMVLIGVTDFEVLSKRAPKELDQIEKACARLLN